MKDLVWKTPHLVDDCDDQYVVPQAIASFQSLSPSSLSSQSPSPSSSPSSASSPSPASSLSSVSSPYSANSISESSVRTPIEKQTILHHHHLCLLYPMCDLRYHWVRFPIRRKLRRIHVIDSPVEYQYLEHDATQRIMNAHSGGNSLKIMIKETRGN